MKRLLVICALALSLGGCAGTPLDKLVTAVTTTITNPVGEVNIYQVQNGYAAALELFAGYRKYCWARPFKALTDDPVSKPICQHRRSIVRAGQLAKANARAALVTAENFIANNPTLNAASVVQAAWTAVSDFQSSLPAPK
jgi:hypothetical protein